jgi:hypothetical protein
MCGGMVAFWATLATRLSLLVGDGTMLLCGLGSRGRHDREPVAIFTGEVLPLYAADIDRALNQLWAPSTARLGSRRSTGA